MAGIRDIRPGSEISWVDILDGTELSQRREVNLGMWLRCRQGLRLIATYIT